MEGRPVNKRTLIQNLWTDTLHAKRDCRGLVGSQAPLSTVTIPEGDIQEHQRCGYCMKRKSKKRK